MRNSSIQAQQSLIYLERRLDDLTDNDQAIPPWTELDAESIAAILREFRLHDLNFRLAVDMLREHDLSPELPTDWCINDFDTPWFPKPNSGSTPRSWWRFWKRG